LQAFPPFVEEVLQFAACYLFLVPCCLLFVAFMVYGFVTVFWGRNNTMSLKDLFWNIALSGKTIEEDETRTSNLFIRYFLMNLALVSGFCILLLFAVESIAQKSYIDACLNGSMAVLCLVAFLIARTKVAPELPILIAVGGYPVFCAGLVMNGAAQGAGFVWMYMYPLMATILMGMKYGILLSLLMIAPVSLIVFVPGLSNYVYQLAASLRLVVAYFLVMGMTIAFEFARAGKEKANLELTRDLKAQRDEIAALKEKADAASEAKSSFLANMSHEIRTPMNAVIGMTELLLRQDLPREAKENLSTIKQAGTNLLSIINDILDFSKIEAGKLEIVEGEYLFASLINDVINIIRMRLGEKPLRFTTRIDGKLPVKLLGDEVRVRQILLNLLTNAVKYTRKGNIVLSVWGQKSETPRNFTLCFEVKDTGIGIRPEDMKKLFGNFMQFDSKRNRSIEGTGLGLAISRNLCHLMGGSLAAESVYGEGSVFTAGIPQKVLDERPFAPVEDVEHKNCLVYEERKAFATSIVYTLDSLEAPNKLARDRDELMRELRGGGYQFVFIAWPAAEEVQKILKENASAITVVAMAEYGKKIPQNCRELYMPTQPVMVANILNGQTTGLGFQDTEFLNIRFTAPEARILTVDDIVSNIDVVSGLLAPYKMIVDKADNGVTAIEMIKKESYDLVLMDHMMPGMDGIEATEAIRAWEAEQHKKPVPIIALTANAISGMKEMFLEKGFNDYLSKPIEIAKLDDMMSRWIPGDKKIKAGRGIRRETPGAGPEWFIPGVDVKQGINMTGGSEAGYRKVLAQFRKDALERLGWFRDFSVASSAEDAQQLAIQAHAIKSAAGTIGAAEVSAEAAILEAAGKAADTQTIIKTLPLFREHLTQLIEAIGKSGEGRSVEGEKSEDLAVSGEQLDSFPAARASPRPSQAFFTSLALLQEALEGKNMKEIDRLLEEMEKLPLDAETREQINDVSDKVLMGEYEGALERVALALASKEM
jgi:signal transduction histidine kinase/CheY-like chemotaxis protein